MKGFFVMKGIIRSQAMLVGIKEEVLLRIGLG